MVLSYVLAVRIASVATSKDSFFILDEPKDPQQPFNSGSPVSLRRLKSKEVVVLVQMHTNT
jgi:hypothetical protein